MKLTRKLIKNILTCAAVCCVGALILNGNSSDGYNEQIRGLLDKDDTTNVTDSTQSDRPRMYTFYVKAQNGGAPGNEGDNLVEEWKKGWFDAGWDPVVLTMAHAKKHPMYKKFRNLFITNGVQNEYEYYCFMRWLATAHVGGGWMSDYDTFPLEITPEDGRNPPKNGELTLHDGMAPALVSGSSDEWNRIVDEIYNILVKKAAPGGFRIQYEGRPSSSFFSDMIAMNEIRMHGSRMGKSLFHYKREVAQYPMKSKTEVNCESTKGFKAVHFSHSTIAGAKQKGKLPIPEGKKWYNRSAYANLIIALWKKQCTDDKTNPERNSATATAL